MEVNYYTVILLWTVLWNCSFVCANYYENINSTDTDDISINKISYLYANSNNTSTQHEESHSLSGESLQRPKDNETSNNLSDGNDLDNRVQEVTVVPINFNASSSEKSHDFFVDDIHNSNMINTTTVEPPTEEPLELGESEDQLLNVTGNGQGLENEGKQDEPQIDLVFEEKRFKEMALKGLMDIFKLTPQIGQDRIVSGPSPEFMVDLYNTITDSYGVTRAKNPYDAHIVRSLGERDNSLNDFFYFKIPKILEDSETVLEAELHIHRLQTPHDQLHPSLYLTPFYILSLYQVLDPTNLAIPDLHKLLGVHYVPALGSGWEIFNVKFSVLNWMGEQMPNHGFLVAATSLGGDRVPVRFSRRGETLHSKQPILVLFTQDSQMVKMMEPPLTVQKSKNLHQNPSPAVVKGDSNNTVDDNESEEEPVNVPTSSLENPRFHHALLYKDSIRHPNSVNRFRSRRSKNQTESHNNTSETIMDSKESSRPCSRQDLFVNFDAIGWSTSIIIAPKGYNAFYCDGRCAFPMEQEIKPSNHATVQSIIHQLNLTPGLGQPCCVPTTLLPISLLYYDDEDTVVLKQYPQMVAESCGCL